jgi:membrane-bound lytic murein transglycosylase B
MHVVHFVLTLALITVAEPSSAERGPLIEAFIDEMSVKHGFDRSTLENAFGKTRSRPQILALMDQAAEPKPWEDYRALFVTPSKVDAGTRFWREHAEILEKAEQRYGVPPEILIAVIGIETNYGRQTGRFMVLEALATLAFEYPRRAPMFRLELEHFLLLAREESLPLEIPLGSYAGAMGIAQFMPGSYRRYAIDFDGDGRRDLFKSNSDAIGSIANYLTAHGWQRNAPVASPAEVAESGLEPFEASRLSTRYSLEELQSLGVTAGGIHPNGRSAIPLTLKNRGGPEYWLGFENFYVITRYNHSVYYAMAVFQLGEELRQRLAGAEATAGQP